MDKLVVLLLVVVIVGHVVVVKVGSDGFDRRGGGREEVRDIGRGQSELLVKGQKHVGCNRVDLVERGVEGKIREEGGEAGGMGGSGKLGVEGRLEAKVKVRGLEGDGVDEGWSVKVRGERGVEE